jgi:hypothetical protein
MASRKRTRTPPRFFADERLALTQEERDRLIIGPKTPEDQEILFAFPPIFSVAIVVNPETTLQERISRYRQLWREHGGFELRPAPWEL